MRFHFRVAVLIVCVVWGIYVFFTSPSRSDLPEWTGPDFIMFRSIGNDLPPRHEAGQSYRNVKFILENEPSFTGLEKRWVVNRIVDKEQEIQIIELLKSNHQQYVHLPFVLDDYSARQFRFEDFHTPDMVHSHDFRKYKSKKQGELMDHIYHAKNRYIMHNNEARNVMLESGIALGALWILPWDGNCFLTEGAWQSIVNSVKKTPQSKYFYVPMARLLESNEVLFDPSFKPKAEDEPQLIFRRDAIERFNPDMRYGRRSKVEMLWRLGVPGLWDTWSIHSWEAVFTPWTLSKDILGKGKVPSAGWVARLFSGRPTLETNLIGRGLDRVTAIRLLIDKADCMVATNIYGADLKKTNFFDQNQLERDRAEYSKSPYLQKMVDAIAQLDTGLAQESFEHTGHIVTALTLGAYMAGKIDYAKEAARMVMKWHHQSDSKKRADIDEYRLCGQFLDSIKLLYGLSALTQSEFEDIQRFFSDYLVHLRGGPDNDLSKMPAAYWSTRVNGVLYDAQVAAIAGFVNDMVAYLHVLQFSKMRLLGHFDAGGVMIANLQSTNLYSDQAREIDAWMHLARMASATGVQLFEFKESEGQIESPILERAARKFLQECREPERVTAAHVYHTCSQFYPGLECSSDVCDTIQDRNVLISSQQLEFLSLIGLPKPIADNEE